MSTIASNEGNIITNMPITNEARDILDDILMGNGFEIPNPVTITFTGYYDGYFKDTAEKIVKRLAPLGYTLNGDVEYNGGFGNGRTVIRNNSVTFLNAEEVAIADATNEALINELRVRGFTVTKN